MAPYLNNLKKGEIVPYRTKGKVRFFVFCSQETIKGQVWARGYDHRNRRHISVPLLNTLKIIL